MATVQVYSNFLLMYENLWYFWFDCICIAQIKHFGCIVPNACFFFFDFFPHTLWTTDMTFNFVQKNTLFDAVKRHWTEERARSFLILCPFPFWGSERLETHVSFIGWCLLQAAVSLISEEPIEMTEYGQGTQNRLIQHFLNLALNGCTPAWMWGKAVS